MKNIVYTILFISVTLNVFWIGFSISNYDEVAKLNKRVVELTTENNKLNTDFNSLKIDYATVSATDGFKNATECEFRYSRLQEFIDKNCKNIPRIGL